MLEVLERIIDDSVMRKGWVEHLDNPHPFSDNPLTIEYVKDKASKSVTDMFAGHKVNDVNRFMKNMIPFFKKHLDGNEMLTLKQSIANYARRQDGDARDALIQKLGMIDSEESFFDNLSEYEDSRRLISELGDDKGSRVYQKFYDYFSDMRPLDIDAYVNHLAVNIVEGDYDIEDENFVETVLKDSAFSLIERTQFAPIMGPIHKRSRRWHDKERVFISNNSFGYVVVALNYPGEDTVPLTVLSLEEDREEALIRAFADNYDGVVNNDDPPKKWVGDVEHGEITHVFKRLIRLATDQKLPTPREVKDYFWFEHEGDKITLFGKKGGETHFLGIGGSKEGAIEDYVTRWLTKMFPQFGRIVRNTDMEQVRGMSDAGRIMAILTTSMVEDLVKGDVIIDGSKFIEEAKSWIIKGGIRVPSEVVHSSFSLGDSPDPDVTDGIKTLLSMDSLMMEYFEQHGLGPDIYLEYLPDLSPPPEKVYLSTESPYISLTLDEFDPSMGELTLKGDKYVGKWSSNISTKDFSGAGLNLTLAVIEHFSNRSAGVEKPLESALKLVKKLPKKVYLHGHAPFVTDVKPECLCLHKTLVLRDGEYVTEGE